MKWLAILLCVLMCACTTLPNSVETHTVTTTSHSMLVPVAEKEKETVEKPVIYTCKPALSPSPVYPDTNEALSTLPFPEAGQKLKQNPKDATQAKRVAYNLFYSVRLMAAGRVMRNARIHQLEVALDGCSK